MDTTSNTRLDRRTVLKLVGATGVAAGVPAAAGAEESVTPQDPDNPEIDSVLQEQWESNQMVEVVARLTRADRANLPSDDRVSVAAELQSHAERTQEPLLEWAERQESVRIVKTFWLANAVVLKVRTARIRPENIAEQQNVRWVHHNVQFEIPEPEVSDVTTESGHDDVTYGLDQINAADVWDNLGVTGSGAEVAILDTGVNADHPDFADFDPDNWQEFDGDGEPVDSDPFDDNGHGSHVSGTTVAPMQPDGEDIPAYGVAPDAELWHAKVLDAGGGGTFAQIIAGMEWAVDDTTAHIVGMSLGAGPTDTSTIEATEHIWDAGLILSASNGNNSLSTPGAYYSSFGSQAIDENYDLASFAVGDWITPEDHFDDPDEIPDHWPDEYVTPHASAAGVDVLSLYPDEYSELSGTSMSQPHKAGTMALMVSAAGDLDRDFFWETLLDTAWQPDQAPSEDPNDEYGHGVIDAYEATQLVALDQNVEGTVTDTDGSPIEGADVTVENPGTSATTDEDGFYDVLAEAGDNTVTADAFGYGEVSHDIDVPEGGTATQDFDLPDELDAYVVEDQPGAIQGGDTIETTLMVAHPETITVSNVAAYEGDLDLFIDGESAEIGEPHDLDGGVGEIDVAVETEADTSGDVELEHSLEGAGDEIVLTTGPTEIHEELFPIAVIDDTEGYGDEWVTVLDNELPGVFEVEHVDSSDALEDIEAYDGYFVHGLDSANEDEWFDATDGIGALYTAQFLGAETLEQRSAILGDPESVSTGSNMATWTITGMHPILDGVAEPGDDVQIHTDTFEDGASFTDTDADVYAEAVDGDNAFAVDEEREDVLLTAVGFGWPEPEDHTDEALAIVANAIEYVAVPDEWDIGVVQEERQSLPPGLGEDVVDRLEAQIGDEHVMDVLTGEEAVEAAAANEYDIYVVNYIDTEHVADFDEHTGDAGTGVVWLDQRGGNRGSDGIPAKSDVLGDPEDTGDSRSRRRPGDPYPVLDIREDHPIFDDVGGPGTRFPIHTASQPDHSWFEGYDGDVVAEIQGGGVSNGSGVGVDEEKATVLLSSFGSTRNVASDEYTEEAELVLGGALEYLSRISGGTTADARVSLPAADD